MIDMFSVSRLHITGWYNNLKANQTACEALWDGNSFV